MRFAYVLNQRFPTEKAYGIQVAKMCDALKTAGVDITLFVPTRKSHINPEPFSYYGVAPFPIQRVVSPDFHLPGRLDWLAFHVKNWISARYLIRAAQVWRPDIIYTRDESVAPFADVFEVHKSVRPYPRMIAISQTIKDALIARGARAADVLVAHDGVDLEAFAIPSEPHQAFTALYAGNLYPWKGVDVFKTAAKRLPKIQCLIIFGRPPREIPRLLKRADVLVLPHLAGSQSQSPLKLFEYMAAQKPIIASNISALREVLNEQNAFLVPPGDPDALADMIMFVRVHPEEAATRAAQAYADVKEYTWQKRAKRILDFLKQVM